MPRRKEKQVTLGRTDWRPGNYLVFLVPFDLPLDPSSERSHYPYIATLITWGVGGGG